jgi:uncharacterized membrane protein YgdD (TMEM256/DUF423 family)
MNRKIILTATILGGLAILLGAFGAHALKKVLVAEQLVTFETGVRYQMYHALFLLLVSVLPAVTEKAKKTLLTLVLSGIILFSGSIYLLATNDITPVNFKVIGFLTPIGGLLLIGAWTVLFIQNFKKKT